MKPRTLTLLTALSLGGAIPAAVADCEPQWDVSIGNPGPASSAVRAWASFDDGSGEALYAGGGFSGITGVDDTRRIARWDGSNWSSVGGGIGGGGFLGVSALAVHDDGSGPALYAGGTFTSLADGTPVLRIARWNGTTWQQVGDGLNGTVSVLGVFDDGNGPALYAGGGFTGSGNTPLNSLAKWNGTSWVDVGGGANAFVQAMYVGDDGDGEALYIGGQFTGVGAIAANAIAKWDGSSWSTLGSGLPETVDDIIIHDDGSGTTVFASGFFSLTFGAPANFVARWNESAGVWEQLGGGLESGGAANILQVFDDGSGSGAELYVGGWFSQADGQTVNGIAKWNGTSWSPLDEGLNSDPDSFYVWNDGTGDALYVGGLFSAAGGLATERVAIWRGCPDDEPGTPGDLNGDGVVDVFDLLILLDAWGACPREGSCPADLNDDGAVDVFDLLILLDSWG